MTYTVYIIQNQHGRFYIGQTQDLEDRLHRHNSDRSKATKGKGPWTLVYTEEYPSRVEAVRRERDIKSRQSRTYIEQLVRTSGA